MCNIHMPCSSACAHFCLHTLYTPVVSKTTSPRGDGGGGTRSSHSPISTISSGLVRVRVGTGVGARVGTGVRVGVGARVGVGVRVRVRLRVRVGGRG